MIPNDVKSIAGGKSRNKFGFHDAAKNADKIAASEEESGKQQHRKEKEVKKPKLKPWEERFNELVVYKVKNGDCNICGKPGALESGCINNIDCTRKGS